MAVERLLCRDANVGKGSGRPGYDAISHIKVRQIGIASINPPTTRSTAQHFDPIHLYLMRALNMPGLFPLLAAALFSASLVLAQSSDFGQSRGNITINPLPRFETCEPALITWSGGYGESLLLPRGLEAWTESARFQQIRCCTFTQLNTPTVMKSCESTSHHATDAESYSDSSRFRFFANDIKSLSYEWSVNLEAGTSFIVNVFDQGNDAYSSPNTIRKSL